MDRFAALTAFVAVIDNGGFAPAARGMGVATSSLTRQVNTLEEQLGTLLLNRSTRSVTLTDDGARYLEDARRILGELEEADRGVRGGHVHPRGVLRVSAPVAFTRLHIAPSIPDFLKRYPLVELDLLSTDNIVNHVEERIDLAIRLGPLESSSLIARKLANHRRMVCASPAYLSECGTPRTPADLSKHNCLVLNYGAGGTHWHFTQDGRTEPMRVRGNFTATGSEALHQAALGGAGLILMPSWLVGSDVKEGRLSQVLPEWEAGTSTAPGAISAVYLPSRRGARKVGAFIDHLAERFGSPPYWETC